MADGTYQCPDCKTVVKVEGRVMNIFIKGLKGWPRHPGCEFGKDIDHIDFSKLERIS